MNGNSRALGPRRISSGRKFRGWNSTNKGSRKLWRLSCSSRTISLKA
jgi:hypothetical protein